MQMVYWHVSVGWHASIGILACKCRNTGMPACVYTNKKFSHIGMLVYVYWHASPKVLAAQ